MERERERETDRDRDRQIDREREKERQRKKGIRGNVQREPISNLGRGCFVSYSANILEKMFASNYFPSRFA